MLEIPILGEMRVMTKGVAIHSVRRSEYDSEDVLEVLAKSKYSDTTKEYVRLVLVEGQTYQAAGDAFGVSRQLVYKRCLEVLQRAGVDTRVPLVSQSVDSNGS